MENKLSKSERMITELKLLRQRKEISVTELSEQFGVSPLTIREDLDELAELVSRIEIVKTYGKAQLYSSQPYAGTYYGETKLKRAMDEKVLIAAYAAEYEVDNDEHLLVDGGSTMVAFLRQLKEKRRLGLHIMSNNATFTEIVANYYEIKYIQIGGILNHRGLVYIQCPGGKEFYKPYGKANFKAIMTGTGFDIEHGLTVNTPEVIEAKRWFINAASMAIFLIDHIKFFARALNTVTYLGLEPEDGAWLEEEKPARIVVDDNWEEKDGKKIISPDFEAFCENNNLKEVELAPEVKQNYPLIRVYETTLLPMRKAKKRE